MPYDIPCPYCKEPVDYKAHVCPHCTQAINTGYKDAGGLKTFLIGALIGLLFLPILKLIDSSSMKEGGLDSMYFGDVWWIGWIIMPVGGGALISWVWAAARRRNA